MSAPIRWAIPNLAGEDAGKNRLKADFTNKINLSECSPGSQSPPHSLRFAPLLNSGKKPCKISTSRCRCAPRLVTVRRKPHVFRVSKKGIAKKQGINRIRGEGAE